MNGLVLASAAEASYQSWYVAACTTSGNGATAQTPFCTIQEAITAARSSNAMIKQIWLQAYSDGTVYKGTGNKAIAPAAVQENGLKTARP